jgi:hypothetical protein
VPPQHRRGRLRIVRGRRLVDVVRHDRIRPNASA